MTLQNYSFLLKYAIISNIFIIFRYCTDENFKIPLQAEKKIIKQQKTNKMRLYFGIIAALACMTASAQVDAGDSTFQHVKGSRLSVGGYGEVAYSRNYFSDHVSRYSQPEAHKDDPSHGRFDIPHAVIYLGYDFGKGWTFGTEVEFEHGGTGIAYEKEDEE